MRRWRRMKAQLAYRREKKKRKAESHPEFAGFCLIAVAVLGVYCTFWPKHAGVAGLYTKGFLSKGIGQATYLLWFLVGYRGAKLLLNREDRQPWRFLLVDFFLLASVCSLLTRPNSERIQTAEEGEESTFLGWE